MADDPKDPKDPKDKPPELPFSVPGEGPHHDGETYDPDVDHVRLNAQCLRVWNVLRCGDWMTLHEISAITGDPLTSVSARIRDFRKGKFGHHVIERERVVETKGLHIYRLIPNPTTPEPEGSEWVE